MGDIEFKLPIVTSETAVSTRLEERKLFVFQCIAGTAHEMGRQKSPSEHKKGLLGLGNIADFSVGRC